MNAVFDEIAFISAINQNSNALQNDLHGLFLVVIALGRRYMFSKLCLMGIHRHSLSLTGVQRYFHFLLLF